MTDTPHHLRNGLSSRLVDGYGVIVAPAWHRAVEGKEFVGTCRGLGSCDGHLIADETHTVGRITWFEAHCNKCGAIVSAPNGKTLPRSSRRDEMPAEAWESRQKNWASLFGKQGS